MTNDTEGIAPALTAEEWAKGEALDGLCEGVIINNGKLVALAEAGCVGVDLDAVKVLALANHALPDTDPRKLGWHDVGMLEGIAGQIEVLHGDGDIDDPIDAGARALLALAAKLAAILPPPEHQ